MFLEISQNLQENPCARVSFWIKLQTWGMRPIILLKKRLWHRCFPLNFAKFLRTPFLKEHLRGLLLKLLIKIRINSFKSPFCIYNRSSHQRCFLGKTIFKNLAIFIGNAFVGVSFYFFIYFFIIFFAKIILQ